MSGEDLAWCVLMLVGLVGSGVFGGLETGFYLLNRVRLDVRSARPGDRAARLLKAEVDRSDRLLANLLIGNNVFNNLGVLGLTALLELRGYSDAAIVVVTALLVTPLLLVFGESLPKELFRIEADRWMYRFVPFLRISRIVFTATGVLVLVLWVAGLVDRVLGSGLGGKDEEDGVKGGGVGGGGLHRAARRRIAGLLKEGVTHGVLSESQTDLVDRALAMSRATVGDEMIAWADVTAVGADWDRRRVLGICTRHGYARLPMVDGAGRVVGVLRQVDLYLNPEMALRELAVEPARLARDMPVREALAVLRQTAEPVGIVERDGRPMGLVTMKDLVEPLTGELSAW